jgi:hypothetical protein
MVCSQRQPRSNDSGIAIVACLLAITLLLALGAALVLTTSAETLIAGNFRSSQQGAYAATAGLEMAIGDLAAFPSWTPVLAGTSRSGFVDGPAGGARTLSDGTTLGLTQIINKANCSRITPCTDSQMDAVTAERPWGSNNPRWQLYAYGPLRNLLPAGTIESAFYVVVLVGDDQDEIDGNPLMDAAGEGDPGSGVIVVRSESFGPRKMHHGVEASLARTSGTLRLVSWRDLPRLDHP